MKLSMAVLALFLGVQADIAFAVPVKARIVLMPISGTLLTVEEKSAVASKLAAALEKKYSVLFGRDVDAFVEKVFQEENMNKDCDADACYRKISNKYDAPMIAVLTVVPAQNGEFNLILKFVDVYQNKIARSRKTVCKECSSVKLANIASGMVEE